MGSKPVSSLSGNLTTSHLNITMDKVREREDTGSVIMSEQWKRSRSWKRFFVMDMVRIRVKIRVSVMVNSKKFSDFF